MQEFLYALIGLIVPWIVGFALSKINPSQMQQFLSSLLQKVLKDKKALNKTENRIGIQLVKLGCQIIKNTPDDSTHQVDVVAAEQIEQILKNLE